MSAGPFPPKDVGCHRTFGSLVVRSCHDMVTRHKCQLWCHIVGTNKNTGEAVNHYACLDTQAPLLHIEAASAFRETAGEVSEFRREQREAALQYDKNLDALNSNLITMHGQSTQLALAQIRTQLALASSPPARPQALIDDEPELPLIPPSQSH